MLGLVVLDARMDIKRLGAGVVGDLVEHGRSRQPGNPGTPATPPPALAAAPDRAPPGRAGRRAGPCGWRGGLRRRRHTTSGVASLNGAKQPTATTGPGGSSDPRQAAPNFARCMRQHGTDLPDPQITANGIDQPLPLRMDRDDPRLTAAEQACHQYGSLGPPKPGGPQSGGRGK
jgi:hypothetical protein